MEGKKEIPDDVKLFLRSVLGASPGIQQSKVLQEYYQMSNERLQYFNLGFKNLYEFLVALEGEVTRLEFSPKFGDNLVYAVLDKTKYASEHAKKYAKKVRTGIKGKSPEEIILWKKDHKGNLPIVLEKKLGRNRRNNGSRNNSGNNTTKTVKRENYSMGRTKEITPTFSEWAVLRKLLPESNGVFTLAIRGIGVNSKIRIERHPLVVHFSPYNMIVNSVKYSTINSIQTTSISFPSFFTAYRAWREKDKTIIVGNRIGIEPSGGNLNALSCPLHMLIVINLPTGLLMSSLVTIFAKYPGLICIEPHPRENYAFVTYSNLESVNRACIEVTSIHVNGISKPVNARILDGRPSMPFGAVDNILKPVENKECLPNAVQEEQPKAVMLSTSSVSDRARPVELEEKEVDIDVFNKRACGFCINYSQYSQMFQITRRKKPKLINEMADEVQFLVTHPIQPIRFWGWLISEHDDTVINDLAKIERDMSDKANKVQPPHVLPKEGNRGAALYKDKEKKESWYRCYVLNTYPEKDKLEVFYCDYGNSEVIPRERFRSTYSETWKVEPLATPFKLYGFEMKEFLSNTDLFDIETEGQILLKGTVVKSSLYSQPHIIEIKDICKASLPSSRIDGKMTGSWCVPVGNVYQGLQISEDTVDEVSDVAEVDDLQESVEDSILDVPEADHVSKSGEGSVDFDTESCTSNQTKVLMESVFDYDEEELVLGILAEAHSPDLLYLKLGDIKQFAELQNILDEVELMLPTNLEKGMSLLYSSKGNRRRVLALQVLPAFGKVKVLHVDHGIIEWVTVTDLHNLDHHLQEAPFQARPASLGGIECFAERLNEASIYLKSEKKNKIIKTNIISESSSGKVRVELFDLHTGKSINKEMIDKGFATRAIGDIITDTDEEVNPNMIPLPVKELTTHKPQVGLLPLPGKNEEPNLNINTKSLLQPNFDSNTKPINLIQTPLGDFGLLINALQLSQKCQDIQDAASSITSWNSENQNPFHVERGHNIDLPNVPVAPFMNVSTWLDKSPVKGFVPQNVCNSETDMEYQEIRANLMEKDEVKNDAKVLVDEVAANDIVLPENENSDNSKEQKTEDGDNSSNILLQGNSPVVPLMSVKTSPYAQPDIVASNIATDEGISQTIDIDGRQIKIGDDNEKEVLNVNEDNKLSLKEITDIRQKWMIEKESLLETKEKLEKLQKLTDEDLTVYYKSLKKEKLQVKIKVKQSQKHIAKLDGEYEEVIQQTNHILSLI